MEFLGATAIAQRSAFSLSSNVGNSDPYVFHRNRSTPLKPTPLWCQPYAAVWRPKSISIRCSLKEDGPVPGPNLAYLMAGIGGLIARSAAVLASGLRAGVRFAFWNIVNLHFTIFMSQALRAALHSPIKVTPLHNPGHVAVGFHFNPVYVAVGLGALSILMWIYVCHNRAKTSGAQGPGNAPTTGTKDDPTDNRAREKEALPPQQKLKASNVSINVNIFKWNCSDENKFNS